MRRRVSGSAAACIVLLAAAGSVVPAEAQIPGGGAQTPQAQVQIDSIAVEGNLRLGSSTIIATAGLRPGEPVTYRDIQSAVKTLWATGEYEDIRVRALGGQAGEPVVLVYEVDERPVLRTVTIQGLERIGTREVRDTTGLRSGETYSEAKVTRAKAFIRDRLAREGIPFAQIDDRIEAVPDAEKEVHLFLDVNEGHRVTVAEVRFQGNEAFGSGTLRGEMGTRPEGFWWFRSGSFDEEEMARDLTERLPDFYSSRGYLDFEVLSDSLIIDPETGKARLEVTVNEGPRYRIADFTIDGNRRFSTSELERYFEAERGGLLRTLGIGGGDVGGEPIFDQSAFREATQRVDELYRNQGYLYAQIEPFVERVAPEEEEGEPHRVRVGWDIREGQPAYVNRISVAGNDYTYDRVIREKVFLLPGDIYSQDRLIQSYQSISALGFFETPMEMPTIDPDPQTGDVDITFHVEEQQTGSINFGTAMGGGTGLAGFLGYDQPNLFGQAKEGSLRWDFGRFINSFNLSFSDPALFGSTVSGQFSLFNSRDRFFQFRTGQRKRLGTQVRFGFPIPGSLRTRFTVGYTISQTTFRLREGVDDTSLFGRPPGTQSTLLLGLNRQTLNHPLFPTTGSRQSINLDLTGGPLGGDGDFARAQVEGTWWVPVGQVGGGSPGSRPVRFALGLSLTGGAIFGNAENFPFDRFWMGGVQFGKSLRGYDETSITPAGYFPERSRDIRDIDRLGDAFLKATASYAVRLNDNISISLFYDGGNIWRDPREVDPNQLFRGAGLGVQLVTPFGPIGLDYAYGFDKPVPGWQLHFRMGPGF